MKMSFHRSLIAVAITTAFAAPAAMAAEQTFVPGNLIVSRTVYAGTAATVAVGQTLPSGAQATYNGSFPNVFKNEVPDASFGVTAPIFLDKLSTSGTLLGSLAIDPSLISSSFASKSELALNVSTNGASVSFMGYVAPKNTLDVSNSNTAAVVDATNPIKSVYARAIVQVDLNSGAMQTTAVNAYSGNNGRAAVLANGSYYMVGNAGNGSATGPVLSQLSDITGVQRIAAGSSGATTAVGAALGTYGSATGYQRGFSIAQLIDPATGTNYAAGKTSKETNFRGLTVFNDTLFVSKGSGSNGVNSVYQVGATGALANGGTISNAAITILPGFNQKSEKVAETPATLTATPHPFGMWFANETTLFVADEGDGQRIGATGKVKTFAGLGEYTLANGSWTQVQTFQHGLIDQATYTDGMPWNVQTDGLRNISGTTNADGSFTIFATTSTISDELTHDLGGDPNELVSINIGASSTSANTTFSVLETAAAGERLGGVVITAVPEPETYALMLGGLGALGFVARRRKPL